MLTITQLPPRCTRKIKRMEDNASPSQSFECFKVENRRRGIDIIPEIKRFILVSASTQNGVKETQSTFLSATINEPDEVHELTKKNKQNI